MQSFVDTFQGHYKDGTNGTRDFRALASFSLIFRLYYYRGSSTTRHHEDQLTSDCILLIIFSISYLTLRPLKKDYMSILEGLLYSTAAITALSILKNSFTDHHYIGKYVIMSLIVLPSVVVFTLFVHRLALRTTTYQNFVFYLKRVLLRRKDTPHITEDDFPYN